MRKLSNKVQNFMFGDFNPSLIGTTGQTTKNAIGVCPADYPGGIIDCTVRIINPGTGTGTYAFRLLKRDTSDIQISEVSGDLDADADNTFVTFKGNGVGVAEGEELVLEDAVTGTISAGAGVYFSLSFYA